MSVLIKGMEKPEHCGYCRFRYDGICHALQKTQYSMNECPLVVIDDAGLNDTISRQDAIDAIRASTSKYTGFMEMEMYTDNDAVEAIEGLPSIDAVPVVRCKDCKWWTKQEDSLQGRCALHGMYPTGEWFCANARREEE